MLQYIVSLRVPSMPEIPMLKEEEDRVRAKQNLEAIATVKGRLRNMGAFGNIEILEESGKFPSFRAKMMPMLAETIRKFPEVRLVQVV